MDQAENLRQIMNSKSEKKIENEKRANVLSISSGKGGVGKTNFAINFSISLQKLGYKVVIIDADIGLGNVEILSGVNLKETISDIIFSNKDVFQVMGNGPEGIKIISGGSGLKELVLLKDENFSKLMIEIEKLQSSFDFIIIDTGAGISDLVLDFIIASNEVIVISTPDPTSIMDSYILIKSLVTKGFAGKINIVPNLVHNKREGMEVYNKLNNASNNFLRVQTKYLGYIDRDRMVNNAVKNQIPFTVSHPNSSLSKSINDIAMNYSNMEIKIGDRKETNFAKRLLNIFKRGD